MLDRTLRSWLAPSTHPPCRTKRCSRARRRLLRAEELESRTNPVGVNLDQWANLDLAWQNGNLGTSNSLYAEGETVPFHMIISGLTAGHSYTVGINWDTTENGGPNTTPHAYDYITDYNESESDPPANPLLDTAGHPIPNVPAGSSSFAIPTDTRVTNGPNGAPGGGDDITQQPGAFKLYGGTLTGVSGYDFTGTYTLGTGYVGATKTAISVTFTAGGTVGNTNVTTVLAWGGHISSRLEWRPEPTAFNISGSPYHMRNGDSIKDNTSGASTNLGNQDRSLKADAVISPGTITVIKQADPEGTTAFPFTMTDQTNFNLVDDGTAANTKAFTLTTFKNYTVAELVPAGWDLTNITIATTQASGDTSTKNVAAGTATLDLDEAEDITVTFFDTAQTPAIDLVKSGSFLDDNHDGDADPGEHISYTFTVTNTGTATLHGVTLTDPLLGGAVTLIDSALGNGAGVLAPGEVETATASYPITQEDIDGCEVDNNARAEGTSPTNAVVHDDANATVPLPENPVILLDKVGVFNDENGDTFADVGETITYTFTVKNDGNVTLDDIQVTDDVVTPSGGASSLAPGDSTVFTGTYVVTQADIDAGFKDNTAVAAGTSRCGDDGDTDTDTAHVPLPQAPAIDLEKSGVFNDEDGDTFADPGETISYTLTVENTGNVTLHGVILTDPLLGGALTLSDLAGNGADVLAPGDVETASASYPITQADIDGCEVNNTARVEGTSPADATVSDEDSATVGLPENAALTLVKTGTFIDTNGDGDADPGETIHYTFTVTNTGNVTLDGVGVSDSVVTPAGGASSLSPGGFTVFTGDYALTQADIDAGFKDNTATASGTSQCGDDEASDEDSAHVTLPQTPAIDLEKFVNGDDADSAPGVAVAVGSTVTFRYALTNTGNVTLHGVSLSDDVLGDILAAGTRVPNPDDNGDAFLDVGETWIYETTAPAVAGQHTNIGTATGSPPTGSNVSDMDPGNYYGNSPPIGSGTAFECVDPNEQVTGQASNDVFDPDGDPLAFAVQSGPAYGVLTLLDPLTGAFRYTANAVFPAGHPTDHFTIRATDPFGQFVDVTYDVELNLPPTAGNDSYSTAMNVSIVGAASIYNNDSDPDGDALTLTAVNGNPVADPTQSVMFTTASGGSVTLFPNGTFNYTPAAGFAGTDSFTYTRMDACEEVTATVSIRVSSNARTQGYWKNHASAWPVSTLTIGGLVYTQSELLAIMTTSVGSGGKANALLILFDQLIAAKLNLANGVAPSAAVTQAIADADVEIFQAIGNVKLAIVKGKANQSVLVPSTLGQQMVATAATLDAFNNSGE